MVTEEGQVKIMDFGLAKLTGGTRLTMAGTTMGTVAYMSPEQVRGEDVDQRSDIWAFGVVLYEMFTQRLPFSGDHATTMMYEILHKEAPRLTELRTDAPPGLEAIVAKTLAKNPADRYQHLGELMSDLERIKRGGVPTATAMLATERLEFAFRRRRKKLLLALIPVAVLIALFLILKRTFIPAELVSVAVLPLEITGSSSEDNTWLAEGIGQSISNKLTNLKNVQVTPWATSQRYRDRSVSLKDLAKDLGVQRLIVGTIRVLGERVHASIALVDPFANQQLWVDEFEEKASDIFEVQTKIALGCAAGLKGKLSGEEEGLVAKPPAERADAFEFYIKGSMKMQSETPEDDNTALAFFDRSIELDPKLAEARVGRGAVYSNRFFWIFDGKEALDAAMENYKKALELDPQSTNARRGLIAQLWQMGLSEECLKQGAAIRKDELNDVGALSVKADAYWVGGLTDKAVPLYEKILQLDRANQSALYFLVLSLNQSLQPQKAIDAGETYFERFGEDPVVHMYVAISHHMLGDLDAARIHYERAIALFGENTSASADLYASDLHRQLGNTAKAISLLTNLSHRLEGKLQAYPSNFRMAGFLADCYARLENYEEAEKLLAQAHEYSYPAHHFLRSAILLLRAGRPKIARTIFQDILSNGTDVLLEVKGIQSMGEKLSEVEKEDFFNKQIKLDAKYRALY